MSENKEIKDYVQEGLKLAEQVAYQDGAVVSKTLIKKDTGTLTLFAFDKREALSEHTTPFDAYVYVFDGRAEITISGKTYNIGCGSIFESIGMLQSCTCV